VGYILLFFGSLGMEWPTSKFRVEACSS